MRTGAPTLTERFVRQGTPEVDLGGTPVSASLFTNAGLLAAPAISEVSRILPLAADVERQNPGLRRALAAVRAVPTVTSYLAAAEEYRRLGIFDQALDQLDQGAALDRNNAAVNDAMARVWRDWGLPGVGLSFAHRAVYVAPRSAIARHTLGTVLYRLGNRAAAERAFREAVGIEPAAWYSWQSLCQVAMDAGRTQEATVNCHRAADVKRDAAKAGIKP